MLPNVYDPQLLNRYSFERNNPWNRVDPSGHIAPIIVAALIIVGLGLISAGGEAFIQHQFAGRIYSKERIYQSFGAGALIGANFVVNPQSALVKGLSFIYAPLSIAESIEEAKKNKEVLNPITSDKSNPNSEELEDCKGPSCKKNTIPEIKPSTPTQDTGGGSSSTSGSTSSRNTGDSSGGGGKCKPSCSTSCSKIHGGGQACYTICTAC